MRRLSRSRVIDDLSYIVGRARPGVAARAWTVQGVTCVAERHSHAGASYGFHIEVLLLTAQRPAWRAMLVSEFWDAGDARTLHSGKWLKLLAGKQPDVMAWIERNREVETAG
jgi:hypothetical protein